MDQHDARVEIEKAEATIAALTTRVALLQGVCGERDRPLVLARRELAEAKARWRSLFEAWWHSGGQAR